MIVDTGARTLTAFGKVIPCVIGRGGAVAASDKREGDGATPKGAWPVRGVLLRPDREFRPPSLPWRWLRPGDGWSDGAQDPAYNRPVTHPHRYSAEQLWREDQVYDAIVTLGYNDDPPVAGLGSAIFLHLTQPDRRPTEGCIAIDRNAMRWLLPRLSAGDRLEIR
ncbi:L,D-transpeptidase family protein [Glacieibacterium sp.]|uniref:L,D-transpeptidase family protein n=1 Tax=Glacieibacterium sp. TaxID=2860237 RepID=UPI003AFFCD46